MQLRNWCVTRSLRLWSKSAEKVQGGFPGEILARCLRTSPASLERLRRQSVPLRSRKGAKAWDDRLGADSFADWRRARVKAGAGGAGCISMLSEWAVERAGPDGGDGGNGGHVIFKVCVRVPVLCGGARVCLWSNHLPTYIQ